VNIKIAGKWMFIPLKMVLIGIDPYPYWYYGCRMIIQLADICRWLVGILGFHTSSVTSGPFNSSSSVPR
jgi:hypothetical protein